MKKNWLFAMGALLLSSGVVSVVFAQSSTPQSTAPTESSTPQVTMTPPKTGGGYTATFTGCVERAAQPGTVAATSQSAGADYGFLLTHSLRGAADRIPAAVGTSGKAAEGPKETTYKLDAPAPTLTPHVGHEVEVTGQVMVLLDGTAAATPGGVFAALGGTPQVKVEKIRMISETCGR